MNDKIREEFQRQVAMSPDKLKLYRTSIKQMADEMQLQPEQLLGSLWLVFKKEISELPQNRIRYILDDVKKQIEQMEKEEFDIVICSK